MTTNHKELCERLRQASIQCSYCGMYETSSNFDLAVSMIESQAARIAELEKERDALREDARQFYNLTQGDATVIIRAPSAEKRDAIVTAANRLRAALQAEKETRS